MADQRRDIVGIEGTELKGKKIILAVTGSASAYRAPDIARLLIRHGGEVIAVMSDMAEQIIHLNLLEWATGNSVVTKLTGRIEHIEYTTGESKADLLLIAPCTANTVGKIANGIDDTPVTSFVASALGANQPIVIALAMHATMYEQPIVQGNIRRLTELGIAFVEPTLEEGKAKLASPETILRAVLDAMPRKDFQGRKVLITAGPTIENIDPIRIITNPSSGKMGAALAFEAIRRGATVTIIHGPITTTLPRQARTISIHTTNEMYNETIKQLESSNYDVVFATAAPSDYSPKTIEKKISTDEHKKLTLELHATQKIVDDIKKVSPNAFLVAFRAQVGLSREELVTDGYARLKQASAELLATNDVGRTDIGFGSDYNEVTLINAKGESRIIERRTKREIAKQLLDAVSDNLNRQNK
ncbi:MAG TPA: bifunctional phosphopantothenoylcysteine decarboxylase/phosphopantothenate--cysteine ligase CoaBC [Candidatus Bathyarchaeia archaeon]|nr:bifunctional phosphopantothenoylcysteine decarboxylase/phosphopantothenate--cysteine ligase CoaBC [Candidatus Bathyarchaeia archaeon]